MRSVGLKTLKNKLSEYVRHAAGGEAYILILHGASILPANILTAGGTRLFQTNARPSSILVDELDAGGLESSPNHLYCRTPRLTYPGFELVDGHHSHPSVLGKILLAP